VFDEFHERHLQADLAVGIGKRLQESTRPDLKILVMSATLDPVPLEKFLPGAKRIELEAPRFPIELMYRPRESVSTFGLEKATSILQSLWKSTNHVLFFESGEEEIKDEFKMPFPDDQPAKLWLGKYLKETLPSSIVEEVGRYEVGKYSHYQLKDFKRTLFKVSKMTV
jgi:hypothetical protein